MASYMDLQGGHSSVFLWYSDVPTRLPEICRALHQNEFPLATRSLLDWMANYFIQCQNFPPGKFPNKDIVIQLLDLFVFYQSLDGFVSKKLTSLDSMQIIDLLCQFFSTGNSAPIMYSVFDSLFGCNRDVKCDQHRAKLLSQLVSMAISVKCVPVLNNAAIWLLNQDCSSNSLALISSIVEDFCVLVPESLPSLEALTLVCPQFACQFMTAASHLFHPTQGLRLQVSTQMPENLLEMFTKWLNQDYSLCILSIQSPLPCVPSFRDRTGYMAPRMYTHFSALPGFVNCCVIGGMQKKQSKDNGSECEEKTQVYSRLLFAILQTLLQAQLLKKGHRMPKELLDVLTSLLTAENLRRIVEMFKKVMKDGNFMPDAEEVQGSLDRFGQIIQVALATGTTHCSRGNIVDICKELPNNQLLSLILSHSNKIDVSQKATASPQKQALAMQH